jgi:hypothetical protein
LPDEGKNTKKLIGRGKIIDKKTTVANPEIHRIRCGRVSNPVGRYIFGERTKGKFRGHPRPGSLKCFLSFSKAC